MAPGGPDVPARRAGAPIRATLAAVVTIAASVIGHVAGGGMRLDAGSLALGVGAAVGFSYWLSRYRWTLSRLVALLLAVQTLLHIVSVELTPRPTMGLLPDGRMVASHVVAALVGAVALRRGEAATWGVVRALALTCLAIVRRQHLPAGGHRHRPSVRMRRLCSRLRETASDSRAPPRRTVLSSS